MNANFSSHNPTTVYRQNKISQVYFIELLSL